MFSIEYWSPKSLNLKAEPFIERAAKVAYRAEAKITEDSYKEFLPRVVIKKRDHSVCEHVGSVVAAHNFSDKDMLDLLEINPLIPYKSMGDEGYKLLVNGRNVVEFMSRPNKLTNNILGTLKEVYPVFLGEYDPGNFSYYGHISAHDYTHDPRFILASYFIKGVSRITETQWVRHRRMSYTVMSGRGVDVTDQEFVWPDPLRGHTEAYEQVKAAMKLYKSFRDVKIAKQDARYLVPQGISTEMLVTASLEWWNYFFMLRSHKPAQWEIRNISRAVQADLHTRYPQYIAPAPVE